MWPIVYSTTPRQAHLILMFDTSNLTSKNFNFDLEILRLRLQNTSTSTTKYFDFDYEKLRLRLRNTLNFELVFIDFETLTSIFEVNKVYFETSTLKYFDTRNAEAYRSVLDILSSKRSVTLGNTVSSSSSHSLKQNKLLNCKVTEYTRGKNVKHCKLT